MAAQNLPITLNDQSVERWVLESELPVALLFCTPTFARCQQIQPLWQALAQQYAGRLRVAQLMVDNNREWARKFGVAALPTTLWLRGGEERQRAEGVPEMEELQERAEALLAGREPRLPEKPQVTGPSSASGPVTLTDGSFEEALRAERPLLVDFWAAWCGPCRMVAPAVESLAKEMGDRALVAKLNVDENPRTAQRYNVMSIPTLLIFEGGKVVDTIVGAQPAPAIRQRLLARL